MATGISEELVTLVHQDREFRLSLLHKAAAVFDVFRKSAGQVVEQVKGLATAEYPVMMEDRGQDDIVVLVGPHAIHIRRPSEVAVRRGDLFDLIGKPTPLYHNLVGMADYLFSENHMAAIEFTRASSRAYLNQRPGTAFVYAVVYVGEETCRVESNGGARDHLAEFARPLSTKGYESWAPTVLRRALYQGLISGVSRWPGPRSTPYELYFLDSAEIRKMPPERRIGFDAPEEVQVTSADQQE